MFFALLAAARTGPPVSSAASTSGLFFSQPHAPQEFCDNVTEIPRIECEALVALYASTNGPDWLYNRGWLVTYTPCTWYGVICGSGRVQQLYLDDNWLWGSIPPELGNLAYLISLRLGTNYGPHVRGNWLTGSIPPELGNYPACSILI